MSTLPESWIQVTLQEICSRIVDGSHNPPKPATNGFPMLSARNIQGGKINFDDFRYISEDGFAIEDARTNIQPNDVLLTIVGTIGRTAVVSPNLPKFTLQRSVAVLRVILLEPHYLSFCLESPKLQKYFEENARGTAQKGIYLQALSKVQIPLSPLPEQKRIADKLVHLLERVNSSKARLENVQDTLKRFKQSVLLAATTGKLTEDWRGSQTDLENWKDVKLSEIAEIKGGITKDSKKQSMADEEIPYLRVANVQRGYIDLSEIKTIRVSADKLEELLLKPGDILFNEGGDIDKLGRGWVWEGQITRCSFQNHVFRARLFNPLNQSKYISWWGNYRGLDYFLRTGKQTTNLASINKSILSNLLISLPPVSEQLEIVRRVEILFDFVDQLEKRVQTAHATLERLTPSILAKAFRGELVPQDPTDEPASVLLERIQAARALETAVPKQRKPRQVKVKSVKTGGDTMKRLEEILSDHLKTTLQELNPNGQTLEAKALWQASELSIDEFYLQLSREVSAGLLRVNGDSPAIVEAA